MPHNNTFLQRIRMIISACSHVNTSLALYAPNDGCEVKSGMLVHA